MSDIDPISSALGIPSIESSAPVHAIVVPIDRKPLEDERLEKDLSADYETVRKNLRELVDVGKGALDGVLAVALEGDSPRAYEVVAMMIKTLSEANREVLDLHDKVKKIRKQEVITNNVSNTTNSIYVGSTKELQDIINTARASSNAYSNRPDILESMQENE
jgi:Terminase DNA packaging enzyme